MDIYVTIKVFPEPGARAETETIIERANALRVDSLSGGAFTPAAGALTGLWGFGGREPMQVPPETERLQAIAHTGSDATVCDALATAVFVLVPEKGM